VRRALLDSALVGALVCAAFAAAAPIGAAAAAPTQGRDVRGDVPGGMSGDATADEAARELDEQLAALLDPALATDAAVAGLAGLGANLAPRLVTYVRPTSERPDGRSPTELDWERLERALDRLPRAATARALETALVGEDDPHTAAVALRVLGRVGAAEQADLFVALLDELGARTVRPGPQLELVRSAAAAVQGRDRDFSRSLAARHERLPAAWRLPVARALAIGDGPDDLELLWQSIGRGSRDENAALALLGELAPHYAGSVPEHRLATLRAKLVSADVAAVEHAVVALGRLGDHVCAEQLIALMTQANPRIRAAAHWGLRELTSLPTGPVPERWEAWLAESRRWWHEHGSALNDELRWGSPEAATERIVEIAGQRLRRGELVAALCTTFERDEEDVVDLAIRCLRELRYGGTARHLVRLLDHPSARVQGRAWRALRELTGFDAGPEPDAWRMALAL
jgi:hypothetical protein